MQILLVIALAAGALWDAFTTVIGTSVTLGGKAPTSFVMGISIVFALIILFFMLATPHIWGGLTPLVPIWIAAVGYDLFTSYIGNQHFFIGGSPNSTEQILLVGITLLVSSAPLALSFFTAR